jgi:hypothetical protein
MAHPAGKRATRLAPHFFAYEAKFLIIRAPHRVAPASFADNVSTHTRKARCLTRQAMPAEASLHQSST